MPRPYRVRFREAWASQPMKAPQRHSKNEKRSHHMSTPITRSTTNKNKLSPLISLPLEILWTILDNLDDIDSLLSAIVTCRRVYDAFQAAERRLIESIFSRYASLRTEPLIYKALVQLRIIIIRDVVKRDIVRSIFEAGWKLLKTKGSGWEELLVPFGRALAWTLVLDGRESDSESVLRLIQRDAMPFWWSKEVQQGRAEVDFALKEFCSDGEFRLSDVDLTDDEKATIWKSGIAFKDQSIVIMYPRPLPQLKTYLRQGFHGLTPLRNYMPFATMSGYPSLHNLGHPNSRRHMRSRRGTIEQTRPQRAPRHDDSQQRSHRR